MSLGEKQVLLDTLQNLVIGHSSATEKERRRVQRGCALFLAQVPKTHLGASQFGSTDASQHRLFPIIQREKMRHEMDTLALRARETMCTAHQMWTHPRILAHHRDTSGHFGICKVRPLSHIKRCNAHVDRDLVATRASPCAAVQGRDRTQSPWVGHVWSEFRASPKQKHSHRHWNTTAREHPVTVSVAPLLRLLLFPFEPR